MAFVTVKPAFRNGLFDQLFDAVVRNDQSITPAQYAQQYRQPAANVIETPEAFLIDIAAPGLSKQDFEIKLDKDVLRVSASKEEKTEGEGKVRRQEFSYFRFERKFTLPEIVDSEAISASYTDGILKITLPKKPEARPLPPRAIEIA